MKGIILAGGTGSRLFPLTLSVSKQLLPVYDKPMIYYPLSVLLLAEIRDILIITTPQDQRAFQNLLGDGSQLGCSFQYAVQEKPNGLAEAFIIGEHFIGNDSVALILGDNIFYGSGFSSLLKSKQGIKGASIFAYPVSNPSRYGVVEFDDTYKVLSLEEKPQHPKSSFAVPGIYFYDNQVVNFAKQIQPSARGEKEITDLNRLYLEDQQLQVEIMTRGMVWLDTGTVDAMEAANEFVRVIEKRTDKKIACLEEIAFLKGYISSHQVVEVANKYGKSPYGDYLRRII